MNEASEETEKGNRVNSRRRLVGAIVLGSASGMLGAAVIAYVAVLIPVSELLLVSLIFFGGIGIGAFIAHIIDPRAVNAAIAINVIFGFALIIVAFPGVIFGS